MEVWNGTQDPEDIGIGFYDVQPFIHPQAAKTNTLNIISRKNKCYMNNKNTPGGFIEVFPSFHE